MLSFTTINTYGMCVKQLLQLYFWTACAQRVLLAVVKVLSVGVHDKVEK